MQWEVDAPPFGFSDSSDSWLPLPEEWATLTVEKEDVGLSLSLKSNVSHSSYVTLDLSLEVLTHLVLDRLLERYEVVVLLSDSLLVCLDRGVGCHSHPSSRALSL